MNIEQGNYILLNLAVKYIEDVELIYEIKKIISSPPPRVAIRGIFELINKNKTKEFTAEDKEMFDDLFYFFG
ncbi:hypothetical protein [Pluralibacter gergoviae]|uniref:hypothetical protein n=1 Tax=Pluralibacter gergoviae TaxID=61647 RepID=UPI000A496ED7|nr:hypothetical protein [Pluralibacter gergoviae]